MENNKKTYERSERKIGEIFEYNGEWYQTVKPQGKCYTCNLFIDGHCASDFSLNGSCFYCHRKDGEDVMFRKLEKVGEPIIAKGRTFQCFTCFGISCEGCVFNTGKNPCDKRNYIEGPCSDREIWVEIKQNEENMEEKKLNLKPFNLEEARAGKPICTRDGSKAIFLTTLQNKRFPVVAVVNCEQEENIYQYDINGICDENIDTLDLMMLPEKKEGWVNVYKDSVYDTKDEALMGRSDCRGYIDTINVSWEE